MSEQEHTFRIYLNILGERRELVLPGYGWSYKEAKLAKSISGGLAPVEIGQAFLNSDPDAVMAIIRVTLERAGKVLTTADQKELESLNLEEVGAAVMQALEATNDPPEPATAGNDTTSTGGPSTPTGSGSPEKPSASTGSNGSGNGRPTEIAASAPIGLPTSGAS